MLLHWPVDDECGAPFHALFTNPIPLSEIPVACSIDPGNCWRWWVAPGEVPDGFSTQIPSPSGAQIDFEFHRTPKQLIKEYRKPVKWLKPHPEILRRVRRLGAEFSGPLVAAQIRRNWSSAFIRE